MLLRAPGGLSTPAFRVLVRLARQSERNTIRLASQSGRAEGPARSAKRARNFGSGWVGKAAQNLERAGLAKRGGFRNCSLTCTCVRACACAHDARSLARITRFLYAAGSHRRHVAAHATRCAQRARERGALCLSGCGAQSQRARARHAARERVACRSSAGKIVVRSSCATATAVF